MRMYVHNKDIPRPLWEQLMHSSPTATWFQSPEAYDFYASLPRVMTPFAFAVARPDRLVALCIGYVTREGTALRRFFTRRAVIIGGPLLADDCTPAELQLLMTTLRDQIARRAIYIETRNFCDFSRWHDAFLHSGFAYLPHYDVHIDCHDRQAMLARISERKLRQVRKARSEGVRISEAHTPEEVREFYRLLRRLYRTRVRRPLFPLSFFLAFVEQKRGVLLLARQSAPASGGESGASSCIIGGMLCPVLPGRALYEWYVVGPAVVTFAALDYANARSLPVFDLMGAGEPGVPYGVRDFKLGFGGTLREYGRYRAVCRPFLFRLGSLAVRLIHPATRPPQSLKALQTP